ncbi:MSMEG_0570 family nitrogen starvation response protein [Solimonas marina]|uniref:MSMEG_0570 family nitrogen starvation response protein n=1 Tax=Solimonas marina TaxID=2714601 RepID=A0A969W9X1_9GAMM|nr:MSMEG_0570 family nitrogen starvation response protein [Solimonas marina]NKF23052.1 MSMEG_0570 family nitrogen starvation response protein [Solimonas marina]
MPEVRFVVRWPDAQRERCYSPSSTVRDFFTPGIAYPLAEFVTRSRNALTLASERVRQRYGYACSSAAEQLAQIEQTAARFAGQQDAQVTVEAFEE